MVVREHRGVREVTICQIIKVGSQRISSVVERMCSSSGACLTITSASAGSPGERTGSPLRSALTRRVFPRRPVTIGVAVLARFLSRLIDLGQLQALCALSEEPDHGFRVVEARASTAGCPKPVVLM